MLIRTVKSQPKALTLCNKKLTLCPRLIGKLYKVLQIDLNNNKLKNLPDEFEDLIQVSIYLKMI